MSIYLVKYIIKFIKWIKVLFLNIGDEQYHIAIGQGENDNRFIPRIGGDSLFHSGNTSGYRKPRNIFIVNENNPTEYYPMLQCEYRLVGHGNVWKPFDVLNIPIGKMYIRKLDEDGNILFKIKNYTVFPDFLLTSDLLITVKGAKYCQCSLPLQQ